MKRIILSKIVFFLLFVFCLSIVNAVVVKAESAPLHVEMSKKFLNETLAILTDAKKTEQQKRQIIVNKYVENVNFRWNAKVALGRSFLQLSQQDQNEYVNEYAKFLIYAWLPKLSYNEKSDVKISVADKSEKINETDANITLVVVMKDGTKYEVLLRTRITKENKFEILNIYFENIDLASSYRTQFTGYIEENKNDPRSIIRYLKEQNREKRKTVDFNIINLRIA